MKKRLLYILATCSVLTACQDMDDIVTPPFEQDGEQINVGGITVTDILDVNVTEPTSRAVETDAAEQQKWLITPLKQGLDITYGSVGNARTEEVAILKLQESASTGQELAGPSDNQYAVDIESKWAIYSFKYRKSEGKRPDALWSGNGAHYFEGQYVPQNLRYGAGTANTTSTQETVNTTTAPGLHSNQTDKTGTDITTGNYTLLTQYLGMPASFRLAATVARIRLPFRHRLCRVLAYVLIDPGLGADVTLEGYKKTDAEKTSGKDDPETTELHFCNVDVLAGVEDVENDTHHHTLTPKWMSARKVVPHFVGEHGSKDKTGNDLDENFLVYYDLNNETYIFPTNSTWAAKKSAYKAALSAHSGNIEETEKACKIRQINYGKVPVYDIIARPTYTKIENVMYDEEGVKKTDGTEDNDKKKQYLAEKNKIDFDLTLSNGLQYAKEFTFDLDANYQTVVYLRISQESVDYNSSGAELWINETNNDDWYGVDNQNGNSLSMAGSTWQRAFTCDAKVSDDKVTDGGFYNEATPGEDGTAGQYLSANTWKKYFAQAYKGGAHHGDYFILTKDIDIYAEDLPINFKFTGHLDAQGHTITLKNTGVWRTSTIDPFDKLSQKKTDAEGNVIDVYEEIPQLYWIKQIAQSKTGGVTDGIPEGSYIKFEMDKATPADITNDMLVFSKDDQGIFHLYTNRYFYKKTGTALFYGLNGIYTTKQEEAANPYSIPANQWEANVHKEKNDKGTAKEYWVPYKGATSGWRAEVINTKVKGTMFATEAEITGNVQNCFDGADANTKVENRTPEYPKYK